MDKQSEVCYSIRAGTAKIMVIFWLAYQVLLIEIQVLST